jgi:threonine-phosphate decarboxylase
VEPEAILLGNGATDLIHFMAGQIRASEVTLVVPTFTEFHRVYPGARQVAWEQPNAWPAATMLIVTNPNNPTGEYKRIDCEQPMLVDESFLDFTGRASAAERMRPDWIVLRSLTKFYALPGLRIGALVAHPDRVRTWRGLRAPWQVNVLAEAATLAAISDSAHADRTRAFVQQERDWLYSRLMRIRNVRPRESCANYMMVELDWDSGELADFLLARKILVRKIGGNAIRIAVRTRTENERFLAAVEHFACA